MAETDVKKLSRQVQALIVNKDIPQEKMVVVRTLMNNKNLHPEEKYRAIIDLLENCEDKKITLHYEDEKKPEPKKSSRVKVKKKPAKIFFGPTQSSVYVDDLHGRYKHLKFFKKRYLVSADNRFRFSFKKRLIPTKKFYRVMGKIRQYQDTLQAKLPAIIESILNDPEIDKPVTFNYIRVLQKWMLVYPLSQTPFEQVKWMDQGFFETEFLDYIKYYFSFLEMDAESRKEIVFMVENKLREMDEYKKLEIVETDTDSEKIEKEKVNLKKEQGLYNYIMILRSFITSWNNMGEGAVCNYLRGKFNINSIGDFILIVSKALFFKRNIDMNDLVGYYKIDPLKVRKDSWDYSEEYLKQVGKDQHSRRQKYVDNLKEKLFPLDEINSFINMSHEGKDILALSFDIHWHRVKKKRKEAENIYEDDFFTFLDDSVNYFYHALLPLIDGTTIAFTDGNNRYETSIFGIKYFENEVALLSDLQREMNQFRIANPSLKISLEEARRIMAGQLNSLMNIKRYITMIGNLFYNFGRELLEVRLSHMRWIANKNREKQPAREPLTSREDLAEENLPLPFYDCRLAEIEGLDPLFNQFIGEAVLTESIKGGVLIYFIAFCFQLAYACRDEMLLRELSDRKELKRRIRGLSK